MVLEPTWLESPDIQGFRTCFKSSVSQLEPIENRDFLNPLKVKKSAIIVTKIMWGLWSVAFDIVFRPLVMKLKPKALHGWKALTFRIPEHVLNSL
jgi:hypothetical protein